MGGNVLQRSRSSVCSALLCLLGQAVLSARYVLFAKLAKFAMFNRFKSVRLVHYVRYVCCVSSVSYIRSAHSIAHFALIRCGMRPRNMGLLKCEGGSCGVGKRQAIMNRVVERGAATRYPVRYRIADSRSWAGSGGFWRLCYLRLA